MGFNFFSYLNAEKGKVSAVPKLYMRIHSSTGSKIFIEKYCDGEKNSLLSRTLKNSEKEFFYHHHISKEKEEVFDSLFRVRGDAYIISLNCHKENLIQAIENEKFHTCIIKAENYHDLQEKMYSKNHEIETFWGNDYKEKEDPIGCRCF